LATVITSLATAIPVVGKHIMYWLWGGFSVDNPTLNRFYSFHYTLPFVLAGLSIFHIAALHQYGSTNPLSVNSQSSLVSFGTYFGSKDLVGALYLLLLFSILVFFYPDLLGHPDNLIPANPYSTPQHIVPEWYFLWVYAILRSIPNKAMGVLAIGLVFAALFLMPFIGLGGGKFRVITEWLYWTFLADVLLLTWLGGNEITPITSLVGQLCTGYLFLYLLVFQPLVGYLETQLSHGTVREGFFTSPIIGVLSFGYSTQPDKQDPLVLKLIKGFLALYYSWLKLLFRWVYHSLVSGVPVQIALVANMAGYLLHNAFLVFGSIVFLIFLLSVNLTLLMIVAILGQVAPNFTQDAIGVTDSVAFSVLKSGSFATLKTALGVGGAVFLYNGGVVYYADMAANSAMERAAATIPDTEPFKYDKVLELRKDTFTATLDRFGLTPKMLLNTNSK
jgi:hypothetical protein